MQLDDVTLAVIHYKPDDFDESNTILYENINNRFYYWMELERVKKIYTLTPCFYKEGK